VNGEDGDPVDAVDVVVAQCILPEYVWLERTPAHQWDVAVLKDMTTCQVSLAPYARIKNSQATEEPR
jgi:cbb3-type cytochrome oxidase cytochrome c subunit